MHFLPETAVFSSPPELWLASPRKKSHRRCFSGRSTSLFLIGASMNANIWSYPSRFGSPWIAVLVSSMFLPLAYLECSTSSTPAIVFGYVSCRCFLGIEANFFIFLLKMVRQRKLRSRSKGDVPADRPSSQLIAVAALVSWFILSAAYLKFYYALKSLGVDRRSPPAPFHTPPRGKLTLLRLAQRSHTPARYSPISATSASSFPSSSYSSPDSLLSFPATGLRPRSSRPTCAHFLLTAFRGLV